MDSVGKTVTLTLILAFAWQSLCAAESQTIRVSCTIPAIPGVNCDLVEQHQPASSAQQTAYAQPKERLDETESRQEEQPDESKHEEKIEADEEGQTMLVKTLYAR